jgi:hypothetical protein
VSARGWKAINVYVLNFMQRKAASQRNDLFHIRSFGVGSVVSVVQFVIILFYKVFISFLNNSEPTNSCFEQHSESVIFSWLAVRQHLPC